MQDAATPSSRLPLNLFALVDIATQPTRGLSTNASVRILTTGIKTFVDEALILFCQLQRVRSVGDGVPKMSSTNCRRSGRELIKDALTVLQGCSQTRRLAPGIADAVVPSVGRTNPAGEHRCQPSLTSAED